MKLSRLLVLAAAGLVFGSVASADTVDPAIGVKGGTGSVLWTGSAVFNINSDVSVGGTTSCSEGQCDFTSEVFFSSNDLFNFDYLFDRPQNVGFSVTGDSAFNELTVVSGIDTATPEAILAGGLVIGCGDCVTTFIRAFSPAAANGLAEFQLEMNGVIDGTSVTVTSNVPMPAPEPTSVVLMLSGLAVFGLRRFRSPVKLANLAS
jgi:hypothetical protein